MIIGKIDSVIASYQRLVDDRLKYEGADHAILKIVIAADMAEDMTKSCYSGLNVFLTGT